MVKKRAKLSGQGIEKFFQDTPPQGGSQETKSIPEKRIISANAEKFSTPIEIPEDFIKKVNELKEIIRAFKKLVKPEEFKKMKSNDLKKKIEQ